MDLTTIIDWIATQAAAFWPWFLNTATALMQPWRLIQIGLLLLCFAVAWLADRRLAPAMDAWMRRQTLTPRRARFLILVRDRILGLAFVALAWLAYGALHETTWPSRSYLLGLAATLATALVLIGLFSRLIRNRTLRRSARWTGWIVVTLYLLGLMPQTVEVLDRLALTVGETRISVLLALKAVATFAALVMLARWLSHLAHNRLVAADDISPSMRVLSEKALAVLLYGLAVWVGLNAVGFDLTTLTVLSGAIGVGLGFGLQKVVSNLVSGVILLLDKSIKPGDVISLGETFGWITALGARYASVVTRDGREYLIPNEDLITGQVVNWSHSDDLVRLDIYFGVSYASDPHEVRRLAREAAAGVRRVVAAKPPVCHIVGFGDSSIDFILRFWISDPTGGLTNVRGDVFLALWDAFKEAGVEIPFPRRDVTLLNAGEVGSRPAPAADPPASGAPAD